MCGSSQWDNCWYWSSRSDKIWCDSYLVVVSVVLMCVVFEGLIIVGVVELCVDSYPENLFTFEQKKGFGNKFF